MHRLWLKFPTNCFSRSGEVCDIVGVEPYVLRFWETEFPNLAPEKSKAGHRVYKRKDVENGPRVKQLLYDRGFTIAGARKQLAKSRTSRKAERDKVLTRVRKELQDILTLLETENLKWTNRDVAQPGSAHAWGACGRRFKSSRPDSPAT